MIHELIDGKALNVAMPNVDDKRAVRKFFKVAPDMAANSYKQYVTTLCKGYLEDMKA